MPNRFVERDIWSYMTRGHARGKLDYDLINRITHEQGAVVYRSKPNSGDNHLVWRFYIGTDAGVDHSALPIRMLADPVGKLLNFVGTEEPYNLAMTKSYGGETVLARINFDQDRGLAKVEFVESKPPYAHLEELKKVEGATEGKPEQPGALIDKMVELWVKGTGKK